METLNEKIKNCNRWKEAKKDLKKFNKMIKLNRQYPTKLMTPPLQTLPYETDLYAL